jgi:hypothetical protein
VFEHNLQSVIFYFEMMSALFWMKRYWGENISIYRMHKLLFTIGTFTRLRSCIVPAEITEPPPISGGQNHKYDRLVEYFSQKIIYRMHKLLFTILR